MKKTPESVIDLYNKQVEWFEQNRNPELVEKKYLDRLISLIPHHGTILDLGCGIGSPIGEYFLSKGYQVIGIDGASNMIAKASQLNPEGNWIVADMRTLNLNATFNAIIAWDSFFHLSQDEQREMFKIFRTHLTHKGALLFTSAPKHGIAIGKMNGFDLFHSSLSPEEYYELLSKNEFNILLYYPEDLDCGNHTIWLAQRK